MDLFSILNEARGGTLVEDISAHYDIPKAQAENASKIVLSELVHNIERNTLSNGGVADLVRALGDGHHAQYLSDQNLLASETAREDGNAILSHVTGSKSRSRRIAAYAARDSGVEASTIENMLPTLATLLMGTLAEKTQGPLSDLMQEMTSSSANKTRARAVTAFDQTASVGHHEPLPIPGDHVPGLGGGQSQNPFDDFSDVIRDRGSRRPTVSGEGGSLWNLIRSILGSVLGFQSKGVIGWIVKFIVYRYGWKILSRILRGVFMGR